MVPYILVSILVLAGITLLVLVFGKWHTERSISKTLFSLGLLIVCVAAVLLVMDVIESGVAAVISITGIGLIATSGLSKMRRMR